MSKLSERTTHSPLLFSLKVIDLGTPYLNLTVLTLSLWLLCGAFSLSPSPSFFPFLLHPTPPRPEEAMQKKNNNAITLLKKGQLYFYKGQKAVLSKKRIFY